MAHHQGMRWRPKEERKVIGGVSGDPRQPRGLSASTPEFRPRVKGSTTSKGAGSDRRLSFVPFLPQDDSGDHAEEAHEVVTLLNKELSALLKMKPEEFWREVGSNQSLHALLESYLLFRRRWYDQSAKADIVGGDDDLTRRIFMVLLRMSTEQEPGTPAGTLDILREREVFTVSRIMDICAIYGHHNTELTGRLIRDVFRLQPECLQAVSGTVSKISNTMRTVYGRSIKMMNSNNKVDQKLQNELAEVVDFLYDTVMTLDTFLEIFPSAATMFLSPDSSSGDEDLLSIAGSVHNLLLPSLRKQFTWETLPSLQNGLVKFVWTLIRAAFFEDVKDAGPSLDPSVAGHRFVQTLIALSSGSDESGISILYDVASRFDLSRNIQRLFQTGYMILDDSLYAHMVALLPEAELSYVQESGKQSTGTDVQDTEHEAVLRSYISQIKDLFPSYGDGYISACLEVYDNNPEVVIQHILEGTLHPDLATLDVTMASKPAAENPVLASKDKGKGKLEDKGKGKVAVDEKPQQKPTDSRQGRFVRRTKDADADAVKLLNERVAGSSSRTARLAMQILYDDEYDDSFDDLDAHVNDAGLETDNLVNLVSKRKQESVSETGEGNRVPSSSSGQKPKDKRRDTPLFYVKDGKHYSYKVAGSVPVASLEEAEALKRQEEGLIHGLGAGGNVPVDNLSANDNETEQEEAEEGEVSGSKQHEQQQQHVQSYGRGMGRGRGKPTKQYYMSKSHNKKDLALKKHSASLR